jgi:hypothetical protein
MTDQDIIRLAEAMGLPAESTYSYLVGMNIYEDAPVRTTLGADEFNPYTDANDDFALMPLLLSKGVYIGTPVAEYKTGDVARELLRVIDDE